MKDLLDEILDNNGFDHMEDTDLVDKEKKRRNNFKYLAEAIEEKGEDYLLDLEKEK